MVHLLLEFCYPHIINHESNTYEPISTEDKLPWKADIIIAGDGARRPRKDADV